MRCCEEEVTVFHEASLFSTRNLGFLINAIVKMHMAYHVCPPWTDQCMQIQRDEMRLKT
ncbi:hypothetical protein BVRB_5g118900 isoform B [Beta vulgaris subsp. vulgaris]|nr:hypothetical protein BVRB_5g118900 isoform B [Beta vulgaris subsp. vulgaris]